MRKKVIWSRETFAKLLLFTLYIGCYFISAYLDFKIFGIEYVALALMLVCYWADILISQKGLLYYHSPFFIETVRLLVLAAILYAISVLFQLVHLHFSFAAVQNVFYFVVPPIVAYALANRCREHFDQVFTIVLLFGIAFFVARFWSILNIESIKQISFVDSYSPFEVATTSITDIFFYCTVYFVYRKKRVRMCVAALFGILSFKRLLVVGIIAVVALRLFKDLRTIWRGKSGDSSVKTVPVSICVVAGIAFCLTPAFMHMIMSDSVAAAINSMWGIDINEFIKGRFDLLNFVIDAHPTNYGLGTIAEFMQQSSLSGIRGAANLHNDLYRLYYETTLLGLGCFCYVYLRNTKREIKKFLLTAFFLLNLLVSNTLRNFLPLVLFYLTLISFDATKVSANGKEQKQVEVLSKDS